LIVNDQTGEVVVGCCRATNLCECARHRYIRETTRVLMNDAAVSPPTIFAVLTAREFLRKGDDLGATFKQLLKAARRRWPGCQWFVRWEDQQRGALHANLLVKGVPVEEWHEFGEVVIARWCARVDAEPERQFVEDIRGDAVGYVANKVRHAGKRDQEPELARHKHRTSQTHGYFDRPMAELRAEARRQLHVEALVWRGRSLEVAEHEVSEREQQTWRVVGTPAGQDPDRRRREQARAPFRRTAAVATARDPAKRSGADPQRPNPRPALVTADFDVSTGFPALGPKVEATGRPLRPCEGSGRYRSRRELDPNGGGRWAVAEGTLSDDRGPD
jgi:hypothetical protein